MDIFKVLKEEKAVRKNSTSCKNKTEMKTFSGKEMLEGVH
jgi:hypothetical protein